MMAQNYCCINLEELGNNNYIDGELVYLQRLDVNTNLQMHLRHYQYCISCGQANNIHPADNVPTCLTLRNGINLNQFRQDGGEFTFNLNTRNEYERYIQGDPNFPSPARLNFCPYCGRQYIPIIH